MAEAGNEGPFTIRAVETLAENWHPLRKYSLDFHRRDGSTQQLSREVYINGTAAAVLPYDPERGMVLLIRQPRLPPVLNGAPALLIEACAGMVEEGEAPVQTARREAEQETGCRLHRLRPAGTVYSSPGVCTERLHLFLADYGAADRQGEGGGLKDEGEEIEVLELPLTEAWSMVRSGGIMDAKTVLLLQHLLLESVAEPGAGSGR